MTATAPPRTGLRRVFRDAFVAVGPHRGRLVLLCVLALISGVLETALLLAVARLAIGLAANAGQDDIALDLGPLSFDATPGTLAVVAAGLLVALIVVSVPTARVAAELCAATLVRSRTRLIEAYLSSSWTYRSLHREGHIQEVAGQYAKRTELIVDQVATIALSVFGLATILTGAVLVSPLAAAGAVVVMGLLTLTLRPLSGRVKRLAFRFVTLDDGFTSNVAQTARLSQEIVAFGVGPRVADTLGDEITASGRLLTRQRFVSRMIPMCYVNGALATIVVVLAVLVAGDATSVGALGPLVLLFIRATGYAKGLQVAIQSSIELAPYAEGLEREIAALDAAQAPAGSIDKETVGSVVFDRVSFEYLEDHLVLDEISFAIPAGKVIGIVGKSGGGKTTLSQLLLRLRFPTAGTITVDGDPLTDVTARSWSELVALVPQDNKLLLATVADNIRFYRDGVDQAEVEAAARAAHLHADILEMPEGYDTVVGPGAQSLSGGQAQRLGFARALLGTPKMLILDEPTSALDPRSELLVRQTLADLRGRATIVVIAHRLTTLEICDEVYLVEAGHLRVADDPSEIEAVVTTPTGDATPNGEGGPDQILGPDPTLDVGVGSGSGRTRRRVRA